MERKLIADGNEMWWVIYYSVARYQLLWYLTGKIHFFSGERFTRLAQLLGVISMLSFHFRKPWVHLKSRKFCGHHTSDNSLTCIPNSPTTIWWPFLSKIVENILLLQYFILSAYFLIFLNQNPGKTNIWHDSILKKIPSLNHRSSNILFLVWG